MSDEYMLLLRVAERYIDAIDFLHDSPETQFHFLSYIISFPSTSPHLARFVLKTTLFRSALIFTNIVFFFFSVPRLFVYFLFSSPYPALLYSRETCVFPLSGQTTQQLQPPRATSLFFSTFIYLFILSYSNIHR